MSITLKKRSEIEAHLKWDLTRIFETEEAYENACDELIKMCESFEREYRSEIKEVAIIEGMLDEYCKIKEKMDHISSYASLHLSVDMTDEQCQKRANKMNMIVSELSSKIKFVENELMELSDETLEQAISSIGEYRVYLSDIKQQKKHKLSNDAEELLEQLDIALTLPENGYEITKLSDIAFPDFEVDDRHYPLSYVLFENNYQYSPDTKVRRAAFDAFSKQISRYINTTANYYNTQTQTEKVLSKVRGFESVFDYLLFGQKVSKELFDRQIDLIMEHLAPHMRRYAKLLQKVHKLDKMTFADLKISLDPGYDPEVDIEESKKYVKGALSALGQDYVDMVMRSYEEGWTDYAQNIGKSTGGFCSNPYRKGAYILLSWNGKLSEVFTLVHELGHAGHFILAHDHNNILQEECSLYFIEAPSTANEMLLSNYLMKQSEDPRFKRWVLSSMIANTYYHNFVTHLLEAAYQREVYLKVDKGESLQAGDYCAIKRGVLERFWGDAVEINEGAELTWMRQPHYYMGLYPYTYSAGLTVSTRISQRILEEGQSAADAWIEVLKCGGIKTPQELARMAGVDVSTDEPLRKTIEFIGNIITKLEELTARLDR